MIEPVYLSSISPEDTRRDGSPSRRQPHKRPPEPAEEPEDTFTHSAGAENTEDYGDL